jgi:hypothetical protein
MRSFSLGQEWWDADPEFLDVVLDVALGAVAVWYSPRILPGASGSLIFSRTTGCATGMITHGVIERSLVFGAVGWRLRDALLEVPPR